MPPLYLLIPLLLLLLPPSSHPAISTEDVSAYSTWSSRTLTSKLNFLLYDEDFHNLRQEFYKLDVGSNNNAELEVSINLTFITHSPNNVRYFPFIILTLPPPQPEFPSRAL